MTGAYLRVQRDGKWQNIEVEYLTDMEREDLFNRRQPDELVRWLNLVCKNLAHLVQQGKRPDHSTDA